MNIRLTHIDGKLPNLALMKLSHFFKNQGHRVRFTRSLTRELDEPCYDIVLGSSIFKFSYGRVETLKQQFPGAVIAGTGTPETETVEKFLGVGRYEKYDYSLYPNFQPSIGFTQRGCRLRCKFCVVPQKEGVPRSVNTIPDIWRGNNNKNIILLDNDFFGQQHWRERYDEIIGGGFRVCFCQGINVRLITQEIARSIAQMDYYDSKFKARRLYTAWDNLKDERVFFRGVDLLEREGVKPEHLMVYMLVGFDRNETWERIFYRFDMMKARGILPYPMVYDNDNRDLKLFQKWVIRRHHFNIDFERFRLSGGHPERIQAWS